MFYWILMVLFIGGEWMIGGGKRFGDDGLTTVHDIPATRYLLEN